MTKVIVGSLLGSLTLKRSSIISFIAFFGKRDIWHSGGFLTDIFFEFFILTCSTTLSMTSNFDKALFLLGLCEKRSFWLP